MISVIVSVIVFACVAGGAVIGLFLGALLPPRHPSNDSKDTVKLGMGLIGTMTALLLGLLIASAKSFFNTQNTGLTELSAKVILLDRALAHYGSETKEMRDLLRGVVMRALDAQERAANSGASAGTAESLYEKIQRSSLVFGNRYSVFGIRYSLITDY